MANAMFKLGLIIGGLLIAAAVTVYPWTYWDDFTGGASSVYGMSALLWAPAALIIGVAAGSTFVVLLWPRKRKPG